MIRYSPQVKQEAIKLRKNDKSYREITVALNIQIPKSTLTSWCKNITLTPDYYQKVTATNLHNLKKARKIALKVNKTKRQKYLKNLDQNNKPIAKQIHHFSVGQIALAMLCLGEASKSKSKHKSFSLGSSDPRIITIFLKLLQQMSSFNPTKLRCTIQCRADQDTNSLQLFWQKITNIPPQLFYHPRIDQRTVGKVTQNPNYKGVLVIDYFDKNTQLILESLANLIYYQLQNQGP